MYYDLPDNWGCYYRICNNCGRKYHESEGWCDCDEMDDYKEEDAYYEDQLELDGTHDY